MAHAIGALIGRESILQQAAREAGRLPVIGLEQGFALLPVEVEFYDQLSAEDAVVSGEEYEQFYKLAAPVIRWALRLSALTALAYVETEYFGGAGTQSAIAWAQGAIVFGPAQYDNAAVQQNMASLPLKHQPINMALRAIGVVYDPAKIDEFDTLGLGHYRSNEDWSRQASHSLGSDASLREPE